MSDKLDNLHWKFSDYKQRCVRKEAQRILIDHPTIIYKGTVRHLKVKHIGAGVYEIYKCMEAL